MIHLIRDHDILDEKYTVSWVVLFPLLVILCAHVCGLWNSYTPPTDEEIARFIARREEIEAKTQALQTEADRHNEGSQAAAGGKEGDRKQIGLRQGKNTDRKC